MSFYKSLTSLLLYQIRSLVETYVNDTMNGFRTAATLSTHVLIDSYTRYKAGVHIKLLFQGRHGWKQETLLFNYAFDLIKV